MMRWFRKHQTGMMIFFGVGLMAIFGLGSVVGMLDPGQAGRVQVDPVVATWKGGPLTENQLSNMRLRHWQTLRFLQTLSNEAAEQVGGTTPQNPRPHNPTAGMISPIQGDQPQELNNQMIDRFLLAEKANEEGISINDGMIDDYLVRLGGDAVFSRNDWERINRVANDKTVHIENIRRTLKMELAAQQMRIFRTAGIPSTPNPTEAFELHARNTNRIECEVIPISVDDFIDKTGEPTAAEMRKIFEEGKYNYPDPTGQEPGFKIGRKVSVQYLMADYKTFLENETNKLTDAEIEAEYNRLVEEEDMMVMEIVPEEGTVEAPPTDDPAPSLGNENEDPAPTINLDDPAPSPNAGGSEEPEEGDDRQPQPTSQLLNKLSPQFVSTATQEEAKEAAEGVKEGIQEGAEAIKETVENVTEKAVEGAKEAVQDIKESAEGVAETAQETVEEGSVKLNELLQGEDEKSAEAAANAQEEPEMTEANQSEEGTQGETPVDPLPEGDDIDNMVVPEGEQAGPTMGDDEIKRRPKALKDCVEEIKASLKRADAQRAMDEALKLAEADVRTYQYEYMNWTHAPDSEKGEKPAPLDLKVIADKYKLSFNEAIAVDEIEIESDQLGKVITIQNFSRGPGAPPQPQAVSVGRLIFGEFNDIQMYDPRTASDFLTQSTYMYWLSDRMDARIPEFKESEDKIKMYWKKLEAAKLAMAAGEAIVAQTNGGKVRLSAIDPAKAISTGEFTWFSRGSISTPVGVEAAGNDFMETAFGLAERQAGVAPNASREKIYVIQNLSTEVNAQEVAQDYIENQFFKFKRIPPDVSSAAQYYRDETDISWIRELLNEMDLKFTEEKKEDQ